MTLRGSTIKIRNFLINQHGLHKAVKYLRNKARVFVFVVENLRGEEMLFKIEQSGHIAWSRQLYFKQLFDTEEVMQQPREDSYFISILPRNKI